MQKYETTKLFWDEFLYKLTITNKLAPIFREKKFSYSREILDKIQSQQDENEPLSFSRGIRRSDPVSEEAFRDAKLLFRYFTNRDDYKLRVEQSSLAIYSNDKSWLDDIRAKLSHCVRDLWEPDPKKIELLEKGIIITDKPTDYEYKVTLGHKKFDHQSFANWSIGNPDKVRLGPILLDELKNDGYVNNMYFYARDEKILNLLTLLCSNIRRVDKIVYKSNLDK